MILSSSFVSAQSISCPNIPWGMTMKFDQVDDTVLVSNNGPWDFSSVSSVIDYEMKVLPLDSSIHASNYPNATHVLKSDNGEFFLSYESNSLKSHGKVSPTTTSSYANALTLVPFPFNSSLNHADSITSTLVWNGITANVTEKAEVQGIANGNITMPDGNSYQDAIMLSTVRTTVTGPSPLGTYLTVEEHSKVFWLPGYALPVIEVLHVFSNGNLVFRRSLFLQKLETFNTNEVDEVSVSVYPNPTSDNITLKGISSLTDVSYIHLLDNKGALLRKIGINETQVDLSSLSTGIYFIEIKHQLGSGRIKVIKQ